MGPSKNFFMVLMILVTGVGLWMGGKFLYSIHNYFLLSQSTPAIVSEWKVEELKPGKYTIQASFEFQVGETVLYQQFRFPKPVCQNQYLAEAFINNWEEESWQVWYSPKNPQVASLQKSIPIKSGIYFVLCLGVFLYFSWLRVYVRRMGVVDSH